MTTGRINQVAITPRPLCIPRTSAERRGSGAPRKARGSPERKQSASKSRDRAANEGPLDYNSYHRNREHADGNDAPTRRVPPRRWTADRWEIAEASTTPPNARDANGRRENRDMDDSEPENHNRVSNAGTHPQPATKTRGRDKMIRIRPQQFGARSTEPAAGTYPIRHPCVVPTLPETTPHDATPPPKGGGAGQEGRSTSKPARRERCNCTGGRCTPPRPMLGKVRPWPPTRTMIS